MDPEFSFNTKAHTEKEKYGSKKPNAKVVVHF